MFTPQRLPRSHSVRNNLGSLLRPDSAIAIPRPQYSTTSSPHRRVLDHRTIGLLYTEFTETFHGPLTVSDQQSTGRVYRILLRFGVHSGWLNGYTARRGNGAEEGDRPSLIVLSDLNPPLHVLKLKCRNAESSPNTKEPTPASTG